MLAGVVTLSLGITGAFLLSSLSSGCHRPRLGESGRTAKRDAAESADGQRGAPGASGLPDSIAGFTAAEPSVIAGTGERRTYVRGNARVNVTVARLPMAPQAYDQWVKMSTEGFPQATAVVPADVGNGFYQCASDDGTMRCALLIQLRSGVHVELRGEGSAGRRDLDVIARALSLASSPMAGAIVRSSGIVQP